MRKPTKPLKSSANYTGLIGGIGHLLEAARHAAARAANSLMTATYWEVGRRIVEFEQGGKTRAGYGEELLKRLGEDLTARFGKGFSAPNLSKFRKFYTAYPPGKILSTLSIESPSEIQPAYSGEWASVTGEVRSTMMLTLTDLAKAFPLSWSHYRPKP